MVPDPARGDDLVRNLVPFIQVYFLKIIGIPPGFILNYAGIVQIHDRNNCHHNHYSRR